MSLRTAVETLLGPGALHRLRSTSEDRAALLRTAFRRRAYETHPDRAAALGRSAADLSSEFKRVTEAYQQLSSVTDLTVLFQEADEPLTPDPDDDAEEPYRPWQPPARANATPTAGVRVRPRPVQAPSDSFFQGEIPHHELRFAEFLFYTGRISKKTLLDAVVWQGQQCPRIGRLAILAGFMTPLDVVRLMDEQRKRRAEGLVWGEVAARGGFLTRLQLLTLLGRQRRMHRRIGEFFVERGIFDQAEIDWLVELHEART